MDHMEQVRKLFEHLKEAELPINQPKCEIGKGQVTYLGHEVGQGSVGPRPAKVQAIFHLAGQRIVK